MSAVKQVSKERWPSGVPLTHDDVMIGIRLRRFSWYRHCDELGDKDIHSARSDADLMWEAQCVRHTNRDLTSARDPVWVVTARCESIDCGGRRYAS